METTRHPPDTNTRFWQASPDYHGVLADAGLHRLTISPNGKRYQIQKRLNGPHGSLYAVLKWRKSLALLGPDIPPELAAVIPTLPDQPSEVARPWAKETKSASARFQRVIPISETYAGVIATSDRARRVWMRSSASPVYGIQVQLDGLKKWEPVTTSTSAAYLLAVLQGNVASNPSMDFVLGDKVLQQALANLPDKAKDYEGAKPERLQDVQADLGRPTSLRARPKKRSSARRAR